MINLPKELYDSFPYEIYYRNINLMKTNMLTLEWVAKVLSYRHGIKSLSIDSENNITMESSALDIANDIVMRSYGCEELTNNTYSIHLVETYMSSNYNNLVKCFCLN